MKKITALFIAVLCVISALSVSVCAQTDYTGYVDVDKPTPVEVEFSSDYSSLSWNGINYTQINDSQLRVTVDSISTPVKLNSEQQEILSGMSVDITNQFDIIYASYELKNGGTMYFTYLRDEYIDDYNNAMTNSWDSAKIDFDWPEGNVVLASQQALKQNKAKIYVEQYGDYYDVYIPIRDKEYGIKRGILYVDDDEYYYIDFNDAGIPYDDEFVSESHKDVPAYKITDQELYTKIEAAIDKYYQDDLGFFEDDEFTAKVADVFLVIVFAVIPLAIFVLFLILALRSKTRYKKYFLTISILSVAEIVIFVVLAVLFTVLKG